MSDCIFCKIAHGDIPTDKVYEDDNVIAFKDIEPQAPVHILIIPKKHIESMNEINEGCIHIIKDIHLAIKKIVDELGLCEAGYRLVNNCGSDGGQTVAHLHYHLLAGRNLQWPPG